MLARIKSFFNTWLLLELGRGLMLTGRYMFARKVTVQFPEEKTPMSPRFRGLHALRRYPNGEERCIAVQAVRGRLPGARHHHRVRAARGRHAAARRATTSISPSASSADSARRAAPVDSIVETRVLEYHGEKRGDLIYTKEMLLAVGDRYEAQIAKDRRSGREVPIGIADAR
jgi:NADH-quinone oxidoreductase subunit I